MFIMNSGNCFVVGILVAMSFQFGYYLWLCNCTDFCTSVLCWNFNDILVLVILPCSLFVQIFLF
jgi:hypothetical protein